MKKFRPGSFPGPSRVMVVMLLSSLILLGTSYFFIQAQTTAKEDELSISDFTDEDLIASWEKGDGEYMLPADTGSKVTLHGFDDPNDPICDDCGLVRFLQVADLEAPVTGSSLDKSITLSASRGVSSSVSWSPNDSKAKENTVYTVTITFTPKSGYHFDANTTATIDGVAASVTRVNSRITISKTFGMTGPAPAVVTYGDWEYEPAAGKITKYIGTKTDVSVPSMLNGTRITSIGERAFMSNSTITSVSIPRAITSVGERAFAYCTALRKVSFNDGLKEIGNYAFSSCTSLSDVSLPDSLTKIPFAAFWKCSALKDVSFGKDIQTLAASAFVECGLTHVCIPANVFEEAVKTGAFDSKVTLHLYDDDSDPTCDDCGYIRFLNIADLDAPSTGVQLDKSFSYAASKVSGSSVTWSPSDRTAKPSTVYTVTITFSSNYGYHFDERTTASINGESVSTELVSNRKLTVTKTYPSTAAPTPTATPSPKATPSPRNTPSPRVSATPVPGKSTPTPTRRPDIPITTPTVTPTPSNTPRPTNPPVIPSITPSNTPTPTNTPVPTVTTTPTATPVPGKPTPTLAPGQPTPTTAPGQPTPTITPVPVTPTPTPDPEEEWPTFEDFVERLYTIALNRASEPEGKEFWVKQVVEEGFTGADCARYFLLEAPEFMNRGLNDDDFVETLYKTFFDRESEPEGKAFYLKELKNGTPRTKVVEYFIESTEWCNVCATYGVKSGSLYYKATIPSRNALKFAERLYTCCLGREAEEDGLQFWALRLTNLDESGYTAALKFFESEEFEGFHTTNEEFLERLYHTFMDRDSDEEGIKYWLRRMKDGETRHGVIYDFADSPEFLQICRSYGINTGLEKVEK